MDMVEDVFFPLYIARMGATNEEEIEADQQSQERQQGLQEQEQQRFIMEIENEEMSSILLGIDLWPHAHFGCFMKIENHGSFCRNKL